MLNTILGKKVMQSQKFLEDGRRVPVTTVFAGGNYVVQSMPDRIQLGFGTKKHITKPIAGILKKAGVSQNLRFFRTIATTGVQNGDDTLKVGAPVSVAQVLKPGDLVQVTGVSKGKGFAGVVKRHHFKGGPRTHGQSDRERAPGSIGQTTTPGRVYKGKRMAGRMGGDRVTVKNLEVLDVANDLLTVGGLVPGGRNSLLVITKIGEVKKFVPLYTEKAEEPEEKVETKGEEPKGVELASAEAPEEQRSEEPAQQAEVKAAESTVEPEVKAETKEEVVKEPEEPASAEASAGKGEKDAS